MNNKNEKLNAAEKALAELKANTKVKLGSVPFIAGRSEKSKPA